ncbi:hypothetical protein MA16_Dca024887 [Dendrobium catenatum]|uniref:Uncharacterized protein n=1 Tax=Dendrobium catenatum TaxID=906689 RepID=A0A2I0VVW8_9ASPA|nr:hypothetical protein MA16_Dca024887 [Dendrobium catenatum]
MRLILIRHPSMPGQASSSKSGKAKSKSSKKKAKLKKPVEKKTTTQKAIDSFNMVIANSKDNSSSNKCQSDEVAWVQLRSGKGVFSRRINILSISDSVLVVTRIPLQHFKEIIPGEMHKIEELSTLYLPPLKKGTTPENVLYSPGMQEEENYDW